jgi:hypothetical protein
MNKRSRLKRASQHACTGGIILGSATLALAQDSTDMSKENADLKARVQVLEQMAQKEGLMPSGQSTKLVSAMSDMTISGFVQASYFYNTERPSGGYSDGYLWNTKDNSFSINKVKITFASPPAAADGEKWAAGYRVSLMAGEDAPILNSGSSTTGFDYLREAYIDLNVPVGHGLNIKAGELISLLNYESGDGGAANPNFSQGYQWYYTGDGPEAGVQLAYTFTDWLDVKFRVENGLYAGPISNSNGKGVMGSIDLKPCDKLWVNLIGFGGEGAGTLDVDGGSILAGYQVTSQLGTGFEGDYFDFRPDGAKAGDLWSLGVWVWYDFTPKVGLALRGEYLKDNDGYGINTEFGAPAPFGAGIASTDGHGTLSEVTLTLNYKPVPNLKIQPEIRYNHTSYSGGFNGKENQFIIGAGASYLF